MLHVVMASNEDWFIPAGLDGERRFMMQRANERRQGQHGWFARLHEELEAGGLSALLWDLLQRDITGWAPRSGIPSTRAFVDQKLRNMAPVQQWWFNALSEGELPFQPAQEDSDWALEPVRAFKQDVRESYDMHCRQNGIRSSGNMGKGVERMFAAELRKVCPGLEGQCKERVPEDRPDVKSLGDGRAWCYEVPPLGACRDAMEASLGAPIDWAVRSV
jgi:hypothetical protein